MVLKLRVAASPGPCPSASREEMFNPGTSGLGHARAQFQSSRQAKWAKLGSCGQQPGSVQTALWECGYPGQTSPASLGACSSFLLLLQIRTRDRVFDSISHLINHHLESSVPIISAGSELSLQQPVERRLPPGDLG